MLLTRILVLIVYGVVQQQAQYAASTSHLHVHDSLLISQLFSFQPRIRGSENETAALPSDYSCGFCYEPRRRLLRRIDTVKGICRPTSCLLARAWIENTLTSL